MKDLTIEQRFALQRARYEVSRMSRYELERTAVKLLKSRMQQKNGVQNLLLENGVVFKIEEKQEGLPEIISEETFIELLQMQENDDSMPTDIMDVGWEDDDIDNDGLMMM